MKKLIKVTIISLGLLAVISLIAFILQPNLEEYTDIGKTPQELIHSRGFTSETHFIESTDGYLLQTIRIVNPHLNNATKLKPILLHHGFQCSASAWLVASNGSLHPNGFYIENDQESDIQTIGNSLAFVLATSGYDVWLANARGNIYSQSHRNLSSESNEFWQFNMDDIVKHDYPALFDYIKKQTNVSTISYIGHSQGNLMMFNFLSIRPEYSSSINFIALSPVAFMKHFYAPLIIFKPLSPLAPIVFPRDFAFPYHQPLWLPWACTNPLLRYTLGLAIFQFINWEPLHHLDLHRLPIFLNNLGQGSSTMTLLHFSQLLKAGFPVYYDYEDEEANTRKYRQPTAPAYNYENIHSTRIALIYTEGDWFNPPGDVQLLKNSLNVTLFADYSVPDKDMNHLGLLWSPQAGKLVNQKILEILKRFEAQR